MPNHFHFLVNTTEKSVQLEKVGSIEVSSLANGFRKLLSSYAQAINKQEQRTGSLFRQKTKAKLLSEANAHYPVQCFHYIHQNPVRASLVKRMEDWEFSSFQDYLGIRNGSLCHYESTYQLLGIKKRAA